MLEETGYFRKVMDGEWYKDSCGRFMRWGGSTSASEFEIWREVKDPDSSLPIDEPKLSLSVDECRGLFEGHQPTITKVKEFIKDK